MTTPPSLFHAFLRPTILQILRATGYHSTRPAVLDALTDLAARYLLLLCEGTARHASHNHGDGAAFDVADVRMALQDAGALLPQRLRAEERWEGEEDLRGVEEFLAWFAGQKMRELMAIGAGDGDADGEAKDYLMPLLKKHHKTGNDATFHGTILGRGNNEVGEVQVEGGLETTIQEWIANRSSSLPESDGPHGGPGDARDQRAGGGGGSPASSGLSSVGSPAGEDGNMDLS